MKDPFFILAHQHTGLRSGPESFENERLEVSTVSKAVGAWIEKVGALPYPGMPENAYKLVFDSGTTPGRSAEEFSLSFNEMQSGNLLWTSRTLLTLRQCRRGSNVDSGWDISVRNPLKL